MLATIPAQLAQQRSETTGDSPRTRRAAITRLGLLASGATVVGGLLAACGVGGEGGGAAGGKVSGRVTWLAYTSTEPAIERTNKQETSFREKYPDVQLTVDQQPTAFTDKIAATLASGDPHNVTW